MYALLLIATTQHLALLRQWTTPPHDTPTLSPLLHAVNDVLIVLYQVTRMRLYLFTYCYLACMCCEEVT